MRESLKRNDYEKEINLVGLIRRDDSKREFSGKRKKKIWERKREKDSEY